MSIQLTDEGFVPPTVSVREDRPVTLTVTRVTRARWAEDLKIPDSGITRELPLNEPVVIEFTPEQPGQVEMAAGLFLGKVVVEEQGS